MTIAAGVPGYSVFVPDSHSVTRHDVEDLLFAEADLLDAWNLDDWLGLYTDDARYVVPATDSRDADPDKDLVLVDDDRTRMESRVVRLNSRRAHREYPHSQTRHLVSNVRLGARVDDVLAVTAAFAVFRSRGGRHVDYVGRYDYRLAVVGGQLLIRHKRVELDMTSLRPAYDVAIIL
ncbi:aromatic-ring-hydroxylating dioxygenase subunit beta [Amycolatopsis methanolica]|uniref:Aromatic-ring-hydroxylating dioxygenase beta subunit n=1 Tax=Amycolatopsis methanolica 239 TaxID=1068978 RepID=A0A076MU05_AMYME|nr:aromatic-ring-hydroxylating dioxygenase subunit beta [Amycolatopsis methanolica]AIJ21292.1 aromatic-ring-hydroxylating dioxygenase beta subunit [Amycolatopsis methanolica 239]